MVSSTASYALPAKNVLFISKALKLLQHSLLIAALGLMALHVLIYIAFGVALISFPFDYDQAEGFELNNAILMAEGKCPYCDNDVYPFYGSGYPPFYHIMQIPFVWVFGPEYWYGRLMVFFGTFVIAGAIAYAVNRATGHRTISLLSGMLFLASNYIYHIGPLLRQHLVMVMFETLAVVVIARAIGTDGTKKRRRGLWIGMGLLLAAGYTKQLAIATWGAVFVWLFIRNPRRALIYGIGASFTAALIFGIWMVLTRGEWWTNIIDANVNPFVPGQFGGLLRQYIRLHWVLLIMAGLLVLYEVYFARISLYSLWFIATSVNTLTAGKWGAGDSYFATCLAATCILAGIFVARSVQQQWHFPVNYLTRAAHPLLQKMGSLTLFSGGVGVLATAGLVIYGFTVIKLPTDGFIFDEVSDALGIVPQPGHRYPLYDSAGWTVGYAVTGHLPSQADHDNGQKILERVRQTNLPVITEDAGFTILADKEVVTNPIQLRNLWLNGLYDPTALVAMLDRQEIGLVIFRGSGRFFPDPVLNAIYDAYDLEQVIPMNGFDYEIWSPSPIARPRHQLRDFLLGAPASRYFTVEIPAHYIVDKEAWLRQHMTRWGNWEFAEQNTAATGDCQSFVFVRTNQRVRVQICEVGTETRQINAIHLTDNRILG